jgi:hypothetical protein
MDETVAFYRHEAALAQARAIVADAAAHELRLALDTTRATLDEGTTELLRLRQLVQQQAAELEDLRAQLADVLRSRRQVTLATMIEALNQAVQQGEAALVGRTVAVARAEVRAALAIESGQTGFMLAAPGIYPSSALSTVTVDLRTVPPTPSEEARVRSLAAIDLAVLAIQDELDREWSTAAAGLAGIALIQATAFLTAPERRADTTADQLVGLIASLAALGEPIPQLGPVCGRLEEQRASVSSPPTPDELTALAQALQEVVAILRAT